MVHSSRGRRLPVLGAAVAFVLFASFASADTTPPQLINFGISPAVADTTAAPLTLTVSITAQESNGAGTASITLTLQPSGATVVSRQGVTMTGGTSTNPLFQFTVLVPQFSPAGSYAINLNLTDAASNTATFSPATLQSMGFPSAVTVTDSAFGTVTLSASTANIGSSGGVGSLQVIASNSGFGWIASSNAPWLTITSGSSGTGTGTLEYFVAANTTSSQRTGIITVSGQTFTVIQASAVSSLNTLGSSLVFNYQIGGAAPPAQTLTAYSSGAPLNFTATAASTGNWLSVSPASGVTSTVLSVFVNPVGLAVGVYNGSVTVTAPGSANGSQTAAVMLTVTAGAGITVSPASLAFSYQQGGAAPASQNLSITAAAATAVSISAASSGGWLTVSPSSASTPATVSVSAATAALAPGNYSGSVELTTSSGTQIVPVTLVVTSATAIAVNPSALTFAFAPGGTPPASQTLSLSGPTSGLSYTASASSAGNWLSLGAASGSIPGSLSVMVNPSGLAAGQYAGTITLTPSSGPQQSVMVTLFVNAAGQGFTVSPLALSFGVAPGAISATAQTITITPGGSIQTFTASASTQDGGSWLLVSPSGSTTGPLTVTLAPSQLAVGTHTGSITITGGGSAQSVPVTVFVIPPVTVSSPSLTINYQQGAPAPAAQTVTVSAAGSTQNFTASAVSNANWLSVTPLSGVTPATLSISANPAGLATGAYFGTVTVQESQQYGNTQPISVTLTVGSALGISPSSGSVNYQVGDPNPAALTFSITGDRLASRQRLRATETGSQ